MEDFDEHYKGEWHSADQFTPNSGVKSEIYFIINGKNSEYGFMCQVSCKACSCQLLTKGKAVINSKHTKMTIGSGNGMKKIKLDINEAPHLNAAKKWECKVNNVVMLKN